MVRPMFPKGSYFAVTLALALSMAVGAACSSREKASPPQARVVSDLVHIYVDGALAVDYTLEQSQGAGAELTALLPPAASEAADWHLLEASGSETSNLSLRNFKEVYSEHHVRLQRDDHGRPTLAVLRKPRPDLPAHLQAKLAAPHLQLVNVTKVEVWTVPPPVPSGDESGKLEIRVAGRPPRALEPSDFNGLASAAGGNDADSEAGTDGGVVAAADAETGKGTRRRAQNGERGSGTWELRDVLRLVAPLENIVSATIIDGNAAATQVSAAALAAADPHYVLKLNRRQEFNVKLVSSKASRARENLRNIKVIELTLTDE